MTPSESWTSINLDDHSKRSGGILAKRTILLSGSAILCALIFYLIVSLGWNSVVKCEVDNYRLLSRSRTAIAEIASTNGCGF